MYKKSRPLQITHSLRIGRLWARSRPRGRTFADRRQLPPRAGKPAAHLLRGHAVFVVRAGRRLLSENPLSLNPARFDQYMDPYYEKDVQAGILQPEFAQELVDALWLKYSE